MSSSTGKRGGGRGGGDDAPAATEEWRLAMGSSDLVRVPDQLHRRPPSFLSRLFSGTACGSHAKQRKIANYYERQECLLKEFREMEITNELGGLPSAPTEEELGNLAKGERLAINLSNIINLILFVGKVVASFKTVSMVVIASTLDSLLDLLSGFILWFTAHAMKKPNKYIYPIGKRHMQPVGITVFASVMGCLGFQVLIKSGRDLLSQEPTTFDMYEQVWMVGSMLTAAVVKFFLMLYCRTLKNESLHFSDVITNSVGLVCALLAIRLHWWMDPVGAILIALYTITKWARRVLENVGALIGRSAPAEFLSKLTYLTWNHHEEILHIDTVRAYTFGTNYFVEVDVVLPGDMPLNKAHDIGEALGEKLEQLPEVERAFVHVDFEFTYRPVHKAEV